MSPIPCLEVANACWKPIFAPGDSPESTATFSLAELSNLKGPKARTGENPIDEVPEAQYEVLTLPRGLSTGVSNFYGEHLGI
jgi:hypothetical protein